ncbi:hypothetical protein [Haloferula sp. A504]|uniref:hypothetical protein n=1 Tax=Haloferula sp. A504 TaxID=3373601 RepID=UPI0031C90D85|nr:hypothetical protein [Verrucomicrobiaceae bacterium E54]
MDSIPQISLGTAALIIFGAIASLAMLRGLLRILWGTLVLCLAGLAAFLSWKYAPAISREVLGHEVSALSWVLPLAAFVLSAVLLRLLAQGLFAPLRKPNKEVAEKNRRSPIRWAFTLLLSLIPTALLWFGGATILRHAGSVAEIRTFVESGDMPDHTAFLAELKKSIDVAVPAEWFSRLDPLADEARLNLAKLISVADYPPPKAIPVLEETQIRELILADPDLRQLAKDGRYSEILRDPRLDRLLENDNLRQILSNADL